MSSSEKICQECGAPIPIGLARCPLCNAQVGTVFSESPINPQNPRTRRTAREPVQVDAYHGVEKARERGNNSVILALLSFFCPGLGLISGFASIAMGTMALRTLKRNHVEEGRGPATAGIVIGVISIIAQIGYALYFLRTGLPFT